MKRRLKVVPQPPPGSERLVIRVTDAGMRGDGPLDLLCGVCDQVLAAGVPDGNLSHFRAALIDQLIAGGAVGVRAPKEPLILRCPACGGYNEAD